MTPSRSLIAVHHCRPLVPYNLGLQLQKKLVSKRLSDPTTPNVLLLLQHTPVFTAGRRMKGASTSDEATLIKQKTGLTLFETPRGGQTTFHGPGQLVGYPILDLRTITEKNSSTKPGDEKRPGVSVRGFVHGLEEAMIHACGEFGVHAMRTENTGVWVSEDRKVAALGVQVSRYITSHGFALNCNVDLSYFDAIVPCGLVDKKATSLTREVAGREGEGGREVTVDRAIPAVTAGFEKAFDVDLVPLSTIDAALATEIDELVTFGEKENPYFFCV
ncbi:hypothetical protein HDU79_002163 [Rhizoclosmatium sp. JEL0117]|nr:hypothetical protein HDU79_002163 [Rhizoclosmatium sp. JEL0117]